MTLMQDNKPGNQANSYPESVNYAFFELVWALGIVMVCLFTAMGVVSHYPGF